MNASTPKANRNPSMGGDRRRGLGMRGAFALGLLALILPLAVACGGAGGGEPAASDASGDAANIAPDFTLTLYETETRRKGDTLRLSDLKGSPVVVNFWFPSCPPCVAEMPDLERVYQSHKDQGVEFIGVQQIGLDSAETGQEFIKEIGVTYAVGADEDDIITKYGLLGFPATAFIDRDQNLVRLWQGVVDEEKLEELVQEILN